MVASELIGRLALAGVKLTLLGPDKLAAEPREALTDELRDFIRANKAALIEALKATDRGHERRRQRVLAKLEAEPGRARVAIVDAEADRDAVICTVAIRNVGTCELRVPRDRFDPWLFQEALSRTEAN